jgi:hypothetical protein
MMRRYNTSLFAVQALRNGNRKSVDWDTGPDDLITSAGMLIVADIYEQCQTTTPKHMDTLKHLPVVWWLGMRNVR